MPPSGAKSRKGHGGARDGAGRRAVLNEDQRSWIGAYYQNSWRSLLVDLRGYGNNLMQIGTQSARRAMPGKAHCPNYKVLNAA